MRYRKFGLIDGVSARLWHSLNQIDSVAILHVGLDGRIRHVSSGISRILGHRPEHLLGEPIEALLPSQLAQQHARYLADYIRRRACAQVGASPIVRRTRHFPCEVQQPDGKRVRFSAVAADGREVPISLTVNEVYSESGAVSGFVGMIVDCSEQHALQDRIRHQALHDEDTGLLNWRGLHQAVIDLERGNRQTRRHEGHVLLHLEIDHFSALAFECKAVADHAITMTGRWLASRVQASTAPQQGLVARHFTATEFLIYLAHSDPEAALALAESLREDFCRLNLGTDINPFQTTLSIGVASAESGMTLDHTLSRAANACCMARRLGHDRVVAAAERDMRFFALGHEIRQALRARRIDVYAQRLVPLRPSSEPAPLYFEALCRLRTRKGEVLEPGRVFPAAEKLGLAIALDLYLVERVVRSLQAISGSLRRLGRCSINLSGVTLSNAHALERIRRLICGYGIDATKLCFEITESSRILDRRVALFNARALRAMGCRIALDDFGTGYSNFQSLIQWPIDVVKIDGSYVRQLLGGGPMRVDVEGMIASARARGIEIVAEYVESEGVSLLLRRLGVDFAQGHHYHRAEPLDRLLASLAGVD